MTLVFVVSAFFEIKTRPALSLPTKLPCQKCRARPPRRFRRHESFRGSRSAALAVRFVAPAGPMRTKSPQAGFAPEVVNSGQLASRNAWLPAQSWVRQTLREPWKIVPAADGIGSAIIGA